MARFSRHSRLFGLRSLLDIPLRDRLNPIFVRELRQATRGKIFSTIFLGLLAIGVLISSTPPAMASGYEMASGLLLVFPFLCCVAVPAVLARKMIVQERQNTEELVRITCLRPLRFLTGPLGASAVTMLVCTAGLAPFFAAAFLRGGVPLRIVLWGIVLPCFLGILLCTFALALTAGVTRKLTQNIASAALLGSAILLVVGTIEFLRNWTFGFAIARIPSRPLTLGVSLAFLLPLAGLSVCFVVVARSRFLPPQADRSWAVRGVWLLFLVGCMAVFALNPYGIAVPVAGFPALALFGSPHAARDVSLALALFVAACSFFFLTGEPLCPKRVLLEKRRLKLCFFFLGAGTARAVAYTFVQLVLVAGFMALWVMDSRSRSLIIGPEKLMPGCAIVAYSLFFLGLPTLIVQLCKPNAPPFVRRCAVVGSVLGMTFLSFLLTLPFGADYPNDSLFHILDPFLVVACFVESELPDSYYLGLTAIAAVGFFSLCALAAECRRAEKKLLAGEEHRAG